MIFLINMDFCMDPLTNITNLFGLVESDIARITGSSGIVLAMDIINLSGVNEKKGRMVGDIYITALATSILSELYRHNSEDIHSKTYRIGGDEFVLILPGKNYEEAVDLVSNIKDAFKTILVGQAIDDGDFRIAIIPYYETICTVTDLLKQVSLALAESRDIHESDLALPIWANNLISGMVYRIQDTLSLLRQTHSLALSDEISGLPNHRAAKITLNYILDKHKKNNEAFSVLFIDGDNLKRYNELGYQRGNQMIKELATIINNSLRLSDRAFRWLSGDEFIIPLANTGTKDAIKLGERIRNDVEQSTLKWPFPVTISLGVSSFPADGTTIEEILIKSEIAMTTAKQLGKNKVLYIE